MLISAQEPGSFPDADGLSDEELVGRILAGETTYFDVLYSRYNEKICEYVIHAIGHEVGHDIASQTFLKAYQNLETLRKGECFKPWLYLIAHNTIRDHLRQKKRRQHWIPWFDVKEEHIKEGVCLGTFGQNWEQELEDTAFIREMLQQVSPAFRNCVYLKVFVELKSPEIARVLGIPERSVRRYIEKGERELLLAYNRSTGNTKKEGKK